MGIRRSMIRYMHVLLDGLCFRLFNLRAACPIWKTQPIPFLNLWRRLPKISGLLSLLGSSEDRPIFHGADRASTLIIPEALQSLPFWTASKSLGGMDAYSSSYITLRSSIFVSFSISSFTTNKPREIQTLETLKCPCKISFLWN